MYESYDEYGLNMVILLLLLTNVGLVEESKDKI